MNILHILTLLLQIISISIETIKDSPFPLEFQFSSGLEAIYPYAAKLNNQTIIFTHQEVYSLLEGSYSDFYLIPKRNTFSEYFLINEQSSNYIEFESEEEGKLLYIFPYMNGKTIYLTCNNDTYKQEIKESLAVNPFPKTDEEKLNFFTISFSYIDRNTYKGKIYMLDRQKNIAGLGETSFVISSQGGLFSCKKFEKVNYIYCIYGRSTNTMFYISFNLNSVKFSDNENELFSFESNIVVKAVKIINIGNNIGIGIAMISPNNVIYLFKFLATSFSINWMNYIVTNIPSVDVNAFNILLLDNKYIVISGSNGQEVHCGFYDENLVQIHKNNYNICGYNEFRMTLINENTLNFVYSFHQTYFYYIEQEIINCNNKWYSFSRDDGDDFITIAELMNPIVKYLSQESGIELNYHNENTELHGFFNETNEKGIVVSKVIFNDVEHFYQNIKYIPTSIGSTSIEYRINFVITSNFYIPSPSCLIEIKNQCYSTCKTCNSIGNSISHNCLTCADGAYFLEGTTNCYFNISVGLYLDIEQEMYKKCPEHCSSCQDNKVCLTCDEGYSFLKDYYGDDLYKCVKTCPRQNSIWYLDSKKTFTCLENTSECPYEYPCFNNQTKQCLPEIADINECELSPPKDSTVDNLIEFMDNNILTLYSYNQQINKKTYMISVYNSFTSSHNINSSEIQLNECDHIIRESYQINNGIPYLIGQLEMINKDLLSNPYFFFYTINGTKLNLTYCQNSSITLRNRIRDKHSLTIDSLYVEELRQRDSIDVFNPLDRFFSEKCYSFSDEKERDIAIKDRREHIYQNISLCNEKCEYVNINLKTNQILCKCKIKEVNGYFNFGYPSVNKFSKGVSASNFIVLKCYKEVFNTNLFKHNFGNYIMLFFALCQFILFIRFLCTKKELFKIFLHPSTHHQSKNNITTNCQGDIDTTEIKLNISNKPQVKLKKISEMQGKFNQKKFIQKIPMGVNSSSNNVINEKSLLSNSGERRNSIEDNPEKMSFANAYKNDNRSFIEIFLIRIKHSHPAYNAFCNNPKKIKVVSLSIFIFTCCCDFLFNAFYYNDNYISYIYNKGYNCVHEIPKSIYASFSSIIVRLFINISLLDLPQQGTSQAKAYAKCKSIQKGIIIFFIFIIVFTLIFWYYVSAFCAIYHNTQIYWLYGSLFSFLFSFLFPFIVSFIGTLLRYISIKNKLEFLYHLSKLFDVL